MGGVDPEKNGQFFSEVETLKALMVAHSYDLREFFFHQNVRFATGMKD